MCLKLWDIIRDCQWLSCA